MFTDLNNFLNLTSQSFSQCFIGISESNADGSCFLHHFLSYLLKQKYNVVLLSFSQSFTHFNVVGNKLGNNLNASKEKGQFVFIEGLKLLASAVNAGVVKTDGAWHQTNTEGVNVQTLFGDLKSTIDNAFQKSDSNTVMLIDNINILLDTGVSAVDVSSLLRQLKMYMINKNDGGLIVGVNNDMGEEDEDASFVKRSIQHMSTMSIEVKGLETGYCKDVHGQFRVTWCDTTSREKWPVKVSQFKLTDKNCILFASGMSSAVL